MAVTTVVEARVEEDIRQKAEVILALEGLTVSDALRMILVSTVQDGAMPRYLLRPNATTLEAIDAMDRGEYKSFNTVEELMADLNADD